MTGSVQPDPCTADGCPHTFPHYHVEDADGDRVIRQPDRDEPMRFVLGRVGKGEWHVLPRSVLDHPRDDGELVEVVESREPFPSDEDEIARLTRAARILNDNYLCGTQGAYWHELDPSEQEHWITAVQAVLDAVSSHRDDEARER
jgi:hypothetical protein